MSTPIADRAASQHAVLALVPPGGREPLDEVLDRVVAALQSGFSHYTGVYVYWLDGGTLVLRAFRGRPTDHTRIPVGQGI